jgi:ribosome modulation factor
MKFLFSVLSLLILCQCTASRARLDEKLEQRKLAAFEQKQKEREVYQIGRDDGKSDAELSRPRDPEGRLGGLEEPKRTAYITGYEAGYSEVTAAQAAVARNETAQRAPEQAAAHNAGFEAGLNDKLNGKSRDPDAYQDRFEAKTKDSFLNGYDEGYSSN